MKHLVEMEVEERKYNREQKALFYLGALARSIDEAEERRFKRRLFCNRIYIRSEFENNIKKLFNQVMEKITEYNLEIIMAWALQGFIENYSDDVEKIDPEEKRLYLTAGTSFYGVMKNTEMTIKEIAELWELDTSTLRKAIERGEFKEGEYRKSGGTWLIRKSAVRRVYGEPKKENLDI